MTSTSSLTLIPTLGAHGAVRRLVKQGNPTGGSGCTFDLCLAASLRIAFIIGSHYLLGQEVSKLFPKEVKCINDGRKGMNQDGSSTEGSKVHTSSCCGGAPLMDKICLSGGLYT